MSPHPRSIPAGEPKWPDLPSKPSVQGLWPNRSSSALLQAQQLAITSSQRIRSNLAFTPPGPNMHPHQLSIPAGQGTHLPFEPTPPHRHHQRLTLPVGQGTWPNLSSSPLFQETHPQQLFIPSVQAESSNPSSSLAQEAYPHQLSIPSGQANPIQPFPLPPNVREGYITAQPLSALDQATVQNHGQPPHAPWYTRPMQVACLQIPADGSPIQEIAVQLVENNEGPFPLLPALWNWWPENDPTRTLHVRTPSTFCFSE